MLLQFWKQLSICQKKNLRKTPNLQKKKKRKMKTNVHEYEGSFNQCPYAYHAKTRSTPQKYFFAYLMDDVPKHSEQNIYRSIGVGRPS